MVVHALLKERAMKQQQVVAADAGRTSAGERIPLDQRPTRVPLGYPLSPEQLDNIHGGMISTGLAVTLFRLLYKPIEDYDMLQDVDVVLVEVETQQG
jgi:hypothetical protein